MNIKTLSRIVLTAVLLFFSADAFSQSVKITGKVVDSSASPIIGAAVVVDGTNNGVPTDVNGAFTLNVQPGAKLNVTYVGYVSQTVPVGSQTDITIVLAEDTQQIEDVVVIGYGVQKKSDVTGSIASVKSSDLQNRSSANAVLALQGKAAGVTILNSSAAPGQGSDIRVRGYSSNSGSIGPLLIVDGLKVDNIQYLEPSMIESMEILKDAASAAIYGAEAGNGVVLITTKAGSKAKSGEGTVFYNFQLTRNSLGQKPEVMNAKDYIQWQSEAGQFTLEDLKNDYGYDGKTDTDWAKAVFAPSNTVRHTFGFQGANDRGSYYLSISNLNDNGIIRGDKDTYKRLSAQLNADYKIKKWLTVGSNTSLEKWSRNSVGEHGEYSGSTLLGAIIMDPLTPVVYENDADITAGMQNALAKGIKVYQNADGKYYAVSKLIDNDAANPLIMRDRANSPSQGINVRGTLYANFTPIQGLTVTSRFGYRLAQGYSSTYSEPYYANEKAHAETYSLTANSTSSYYYQWENFANYDFRVGKNNFGTMAGMSYITNRSFGVNAGISGEDPLKGYADNFLYLNQDNGTGTKTIGGGSPSKSTSLAYFGRVTWNYDNRYNLQANFRADAFDTSKLSTKNRWGYFPSFSAGWTISNESFMKDIDRSVLSYLKVRASWGQNGNISVLSGYPYSTSINLNGEKYQYSPTSPTLSLGSKPSGLANPKLTWETSEQIDLGLEARFLDNRLTFGVDYYKKKTKDLLVRITPVAEVGAGQTTVNAGNVENSGFEFELGWRDVKGDFSYSVNTNLATLKNKVTYLDPTVGRTTGAEFADYTLKTYFEQGHSVWYMRGYIYDGVDKATGAPIFRDTDGVEGITDNDMVDVGNGIPDVTYGITINLAYKNFDLTVFGTGVAGNDIYACVYRTQHPRINSLAYFFDNRWTAENHNSSMPSVANMSSNTTFWSSTANLFNGAYFKIKQIQLGYTVPQNISKKIAISNLRVFASLDDYFTFTNYPGFDPEVASNGSANSIGFDKGSYPTSKKVVFGVNVTF